VAHRLRLDRPGVRPRPPAMPSTTWRAFLGGPRPPGVDPLTPATPACPGAGRASRPRSSSTSRRMGGTPAGRALDHHPGSVRLAAPSAPMAGGHLTQPPSGGRCRRWPAGPGSARLAVAPRSRGRPVAPVGLRPHRHRSAPPRISGPRGAAPGPAPSAGGRPARWRRQPEFAGGQVVGAGWRRPGPALSSAMGAEISPCLAAEGAARTRSTARVSAHLDHRRPPPPPGAAARRTCSPSTRQGRGRRRGRSTVTDGFERRPPGLPLRLAPSQGPPGKRGQAS